MKTGISIAMLPVLLLAGPVVCSRYSWGLAAVSGYVRCPQRMRLRTLRCSSMAPFGLTVWGWDEAVSYAFPSGASVQPINTVVVPPMAQ